MEVVYSKQLKKDGVVFTEGKVSSYSNIPAGVWKQIQIPGQGVFTTYPGEYEPSKVKLEDLNFKPSDFWKPRQLHVGSDPEVFLMKGSEVLPAFKVLPKIGHDCEPYWDGFQAEFTTPPQTCVAYLVDRYHKGLNKARAFGPLNMDSVVDIPTEVLAEAKAEHVELGCMPSKNAYADVGIEVTNGRLLRHRFAGMHMHFGDELLVKLPNRDEVTTNIVKALDRVFGVFLTAIGGHLENPIRRLYYGKAGEYRQPKHGLEYRVPGAWVMKHPAILHLAWDMARVAYHIGFLNYTDNIYRCNEDLAREIINTSDFTRARKVVAQNKKFWGEILTSAYGEAYTGIRDKEASVAETFWRIAGGDFDFKTIDENWGFGKHFRPWAEHSANTGACFIKLV